MSQTRSMTHVNARSDMSLVKLVEQFGANEDRCRDFLARLRWPDGVRCLDCGYDKVSTISAPVGRPRKDGTRPKRNVFECSRCKRQFSVTTQTALHDTHLPLWKWFLATYLMVEAKKGVSANQLRRELAVSYKTAWYLCHRIRSAMIDADAEALGGTVEADETAIGGKRKGHRNALSNKSIVLGAVERGGEVRLRALAKGKSPTAITLRAFLADAVGDDAIAIYTDQHPGYGGIGDEDTIHDTVDHSKEEWVRGDVGIQGIESAWSLLKRSIVGSYHQLSAKHLPAYLDEFSFKFNNRDNRYLFRDTLIALCRADALTYTELIGSES